MHDKPDALVECSAGADLDAYEAKYMAGDPTTFRSKTRTSWQAPAFTGAMALFSIVWSAVQGQPLVGLGFAAVTALLGLCFAVMRVRVTPTLVEVDYGLLGPQIPIESIESVETIVHPYRNPLRWGVSPTGKGEWLYAIAGDQGRAVKITWRDCIYQRQVHIIGSHEPERLAGAIRTARGVAAREKMLEQK